MQGPRVSPTLRAPRPAFVGPTNFSERTGCKFAFSPPMYDEYHFRLSRRRFPWPFLVALHTENVCTSNTTLGIDMYDSENMEASSVVADAVSYGALFNDRVPDSMEFEFLARVSRIRIESQIPGHRNGCMPIGNNFLEREGCLNLWNTSLYEAASGGDTLYLMEDAETSCGEGASSGTEGRRPSAPGKEWTSTCCIPATSRVSCKLPTLAGSCRRITRSQAMNKRGTDIPVKVIKEQIYITSVFSLPSAPAQILLGTANACIVTLSVRLVIHPGRLVRYSNSPPAHVRVPLDQLSVSPSVDLQWAHDSGLKAHLGEKMVDRG
ncbi:hypothetical protein DFS33DRAFT_1277163 [Desarmillaria ectypa]|nr:hypothetical protein DFS33DRAFT_1277163 [Desarmillaria ectypa]